MSPPTQPDVAQLPRRSALSQLSCFVGLTGLTTMLLVAARRSVPSWSLPELGLPIAAVLIVSAMFVGARLFPAPREGSDRPG